MLEALMSLFFQEERIKKVEYNPREIEIVMSEEFLPQMKQFLKNEQNLQKFVHTAQENNVKCWVLNYSDNLSGGKKLASMIIPVEYPFKDTYHNYFSVLSLFSFQDKFSKEENKVLQKEKIKETIDFMISEDFNENTSFYDESETSCKDLF